MGFKEEVESQHGTVLNYVVKQGLKALTDAVPFLSSEMIKTITDKADPGIVLGWDKWLDQMVKQGYCDQGTADMLKSLKDEVPVIFWILSLLLRAILWTKTFGISLDIFNIDRQYKLMAQAGPNPAPMEALVASMMIDPKRATENRAELRKYGFNDTQIDNIILARYRTVDENLIRILYLRGHYDTEKLYERMRELGYTDTRTAEIIKTWQLYPPPADLFTMVAHEAFEPDIYKLIGLDEEFPSEQIPWLEAQGISKEWAMKYWISHWNQPSLEMGFDMLHRGIISREELDMLFRVQEIPRFWRDKLMAITYNPYTRVDVRRMHELGVIDTKELVIAYQDLGYDADKAVKMAEFTIRYNAEGDNALTRSAIITAYHDDLISRSDALELLVSQNLSKDAADFYLTLEDYKISQENVKLYIDSTKERFLLGVDTETEARSTLNKLNLRGSKIDALLENWSIDQYKYQALPTKAELNALLINKVITEGQWRTIMTRHGFSFEHQSWYLKLLEREIKVSAASPTKAELISWYKKELISEQTLRAELRTMGYNEEYINLYVKSS